MDTREITDLSPVALAAIAKLVSSVAKDTRDQLTPGKHQVDQVVTLVLNGTVSVAADTDKVPTASIPLLASLALMAKRMGVQRERALDVLREVMTQALELDKDATTELLKETGVADVEKEIKEKVLGKLPRTPVKGSVTVKGSVALPK